MILHEIVKNKERELRERKTKVSLEDLKGRLRDILRGRGDAYKGRPPFAFGEAISKPRKVNLIAEIKGRSPSRGIIKKNFEPKRIASIYEKSGAAALSLLTDKEFFGGSLDYLAQVRQSVSLPILQKDFIIDEYQIYEASLFGAGAILLIMRILDEEQLKEYIDLAAALRMDALVEVHDEDELERALDAGAEIIGINNRDLTTFDVTLETTLRLAPKVPHDRILVSESGISSLADVRRVEAAGVDAILVGSSLMEVEDPGMKIRELLS